MKNSDFLSRLCIGESPVENEFKSVEQGVEANEAALLQVLHKPHRKESGLAGAGIRGGSQEAPRNNK